MLKQEASRKLSLFGADVNLASPVKRGGRRLVNQSSQENVIVQDKNLLNQNKHLDHSVNISAHIPSLIPSDSKHGQSHNNSLLHLQRVEKRNLNTLG